MHGLDKNLDHLLMEHNEKHWLCNRSGSVGKESTCNAGDLGLTPGLGRSPGGGNDNPLQYSCLENPHGERSLMVYSSWGHKESVMTGHRLSTQDKA